MRKKKLDKLVEATKQQAYDEGYKFGEYVATLDRVQLVELVGQLYLELNDLRYQLNKALDALRSIDSIDIGDLLIWGR